MSWTLGVVWKMVRGEAANQSVSMQIFRKLVFSKIVPNVKRLGLLTPYVRKAFEELDVIEYESWDASA